MRGRYLGGIAALGVLLGPVVQPGAQTFIEALVDGRPTIDVRYRLENVDQDGFAREALASTLRTRIGYETRSYEGFFAFVEIENVSAVGNEAFDDTIEGRARFPVVADPETTEINQAVLTTDRLPDSLVRLGRQRIDFDNQRFVGNVGFRQNQQTFDAALITNRSLVDTIATYAYVHNVNRVLGDDSLDGDFESESHLINLAYEGLRLGRLSAYAYLIDLDNQAALSSRTFGLRFAGSHRFWFNRDVGIVYAVEFARQSDHAGHPGDYDESYVLVEPGIIYGDLVARLGYELLGGDGANSFQTPLATLHGFNGVTDKFLVTPTAGLEDRFARVSYELEELGPFESAVLSAAYHDFRSDRLDLDFGSEWSVKAELKVSTAFSVSLEYADFDADLVSTDTQIIWTTLQVLF